MKKILLIKILSLVIALQLLIILSGLYLLQNASRSSYDMDGVFLRPLLIAYKDISINFHVSLDGIPVPESEVLTPELFDIEMREMAESFVINFVPNKKQGDVLGGGISVVVDKTTFMITNKSFQR